MKLCAGGSRVLVAHPLHAIAVADLQLLLGPLEAAVLLVVGGRLEVDVDVVGGLGSRRHGCESKHTNTESEQGRTAAGGDETDGAGDGEASGHADARRTEVEAQHEVGQKKKILTEALPLTWRSSTLSSSDKFKIF